MMQFYRLLSSVAGHYVRIFAYDKVLDDRVKTPPVHRGVQNYSSHINTRKDIYHRVRIYFRYINRSKEYWHRVAKAIKAECVSSSN